MIPNSFNYQKAQSVDEAIALLNAAEDGKLLAGGHSLIPALKLRLNQVGTLIDIAKIPTLNFIREEGHEVVIGAATTHHAIATSALIKDKISMIAEGADLIGDVQVRNVGTIGGSIAHADPAADWPGLLVGSRANIVLQGPNGVRAVNAKDFFNGFYSTALEETELITEIRIPIPPANTQTTYHKFMQPASRYAIVGCAVMVTRENGICTNVTVAFTGVGEYAFRDTTVELALTGKELTPENIKSATDQAANGIDIMSDHFASEKYRQHLARVYAKRALSSIA